MLERLIKKRFAARKQLQYKQFEKKYLSYILIAPTIIILLCVVIFPLIASLGLSFTNYNLATGVLQFIGFRSFLKIWRDEQFLNSLFITLLYLAIVVPSEFTLGFGLALLLNKIPRAKRRLFTSIFLLASMMTPLVMGFMWKYMSHANVGVFNYILGLFGIRARPWLSSPSTALITLAILDIWMWTPFMALILVSGLVSLPKSLYEAAAIDGASSANQFRWITIPMLKPVIIVAIVLRLVDALRTFDPIVVTTKGGPGEKTELISFYIYKVAFNFFEMGRAMAISWIFLIITIILAQIFIRTLEKQEYD